MPLPRGIQNSNPGNIRKSAMPWRGELVPGTDVAFCQFADPRDGIRAIMVLLKRYYYVLGLTSVSQIITRWAPPSENNTAAYIKAVAWQMAVDPNAALSMSQDTYIGFAQAIVLHENGNPPITFPSRWYSPLVYQDAYRLTVPNVEPTSHSAG